jgi:hypothetical protein
MHRVTVSENARAPGHWTNRLRTKSTLGEFSRKRGLSPFSRGLSPFSREEANLFFQVVFFQVVAQRYEKGSMILTATMLDRILFHRQRLA